jgi:hypothetical protein
MLAKSLVPARLLGVFVGFTSSFAGGYLFRCFSSHDRSWKDIGLMELPLFLLAAASARWRMRGVKDRDKPGSRNREEEMGGEFKGWV